MKQSGFVAMLPLQVFFCFCLYFVALIVDFAILKLEQKDHITNLEDFDALELRVKTVRCCSFTFLPMRIASHKTNRMEECMWQTLKWTLWLRTTFIRLSSPPQKIHGQMS